MNFCEVLFSKIRRTNHDNLFGDIIGYYHIKRLFRMALDCDCVVHILLVGPPSSAKTMFLTSLMHHLKNCYFTDGTNSTKAGMIDYVFENRPRFLFIDEIEKMALKDQAMLLNLMETGIVTETKYGKTRSTKIMTSVFARSNDVSRLSAPLQSRFFIVRLEPYTYEQFCGITEGLLSRQKIDGPVANIIAEAVWNKSQDVRDCMKIGTLAKSPKDVEFILNKFLGPLIREGEIQTLGNNKNNSHRVTCKSQPSYQTNVLIFDFFNTYGLIKKYVNQEKHLCACNSRVLICNPCHLRKSIPLISS